MPRMLSGMVTRMSRQVTRQDRRPKMRSIFNPAPMSATMTTNSVKRSVTSG
jgi:hypothetical protein